MPPKDRQPDQAREYELYILAQKWIAPFCCKNPDRCPNISAEHYLATHLSLHGLWPSHADGSWPSKCSKSKHAMHIPEGYYQARKFAANLAEHKEFARHEWHEHGSCSGLTAEDYFKECLRAHVASRGVSSEHHEGTPSLIRRNVGKRVALDELKRQYFTSVAMQCDKRCALQEVFTCYRRSPANKAGEQINCPKAVMRQHDSCAKHRCSHVLIRKLGQCDAPG
jgi:ribonuclease T2